MKGPIKIKWMQRFRQKPLLFLLWFCLIVFLSVLTGIAPEIISSDFENWFRSTSGEDYKFIFVIAFIAGTAVLVYLTIDLSSFHPGSRERKGELLTIPWTLEDVTHAKAAKRAMLKGELDQALDSLFEMDIPQLNNEITILASRLAQYKRESRQGVQSVEGGTIKKNRISRDILSLITDVEKSLDREGELNAKIRTYLTKRYQNQLDHKLTGRQPINLRKSATSQGTSKETSSYFVTLPSDEVQDKIEGIFREAKGRLLITGVPGAGKTVVTLQLVLALLKERTNVIPVLLNLATWQSSFIKLETWLGEILPTELGVNSLLAKQVLTKIPLVLFLDGLDEVNEEDRESCLEAIGVFGANAENKFVITTRKQEYIETERDAPVFSQIEVEPLQFEQIEQELKRIGYQQPEAFPLLQAIEKDEVLREVVKTPFYFNVLQQVFAQGKRLSDLDFQSTSVPGRQLEIVEKFCTEQLILKEKKWSRRDSVHWLSFLASRMRQKNIVTFELKDLQYDWFSGSIINYSIAWLLFGLIQGLYWGIFLGLLSGLALGGIIFFLAIFSNDPVVTSWFLLLIPLGFITFGSFVGIIGGVFFGSFVGLFSWCFGEWNYDEHLYKKNYSFKANIIFGLIYGLIGGLFLAGAMWIYDWLYSNLVLSYLFDISTFADVKFKMAPIYTMTILGGCISLLASGDSNPMIGPKISTKENFKWSKVFFLEELFSLLSIPQDIRFGAFIVFIFGIGYTIKENLLYGIFVSFSTALFLILSTGAMILLLGVLRLWNESFYDTLSMNSPYQRFRASIKKLYFSILSHWHIRFQIYTRGFLPLQLVDFLNDMTENYIMESDGSTWRFRHRIIQDHFAENWKKEQRQPRRS